MQDFKAIRTELAKKGMCRNHWNTPAVAGGKQCQVCLWRQQESNVKTSYGISIEEYARMELAQNRKCKICLRSCNTGRDLAVDHDHKTGQVRGLLCSNCNQAVGKLQDSPELAERLAHYLRSTTCH
jgi:hypothetical protein